MIRRILKTVFFGLLFSSFNQIQTHQDNTNDFSSVTQNLNKKIIHVDTVTKLLNKALSADTLEFYNEFTFPDWESFLFFKSGNFLSKKEKNVLVIRCVSDTAYLTELYSINNNQWILSDSINGLDAFPAQFDPMFYDYNFDGQTDIYIQVNASNGYSLSRGNLLIVDPLTKELNYHTEARDFANMKPDPKAKIVVSELWNGYNNKGKHQLTVFSNKWINGQLKTVHKKSITLN